jgi:hypothetical protein
VRLTLRSILFGPVTMQGLAIMQPNFMRVVPQIPRGNLAQRSENQPGLSLIAATSHSIYPVTPHFTCTSSSVLYSPSSLFTPHTQCRFDRAYGLLSSPSVMYSAKLSIVNRSASDGSPQPQTPWELRQRRQQRRRRPS